MRKLVISFITTVFFGLLILNTHGQNTAKDSAVLLLHQLEKAYERGRISRQLYLDTVHSTMRSLLSVDIQFTNKELLSHLERYRQIIWNNKELAEEKRIYYGMLSNQAQMAGRTGEMLYYADKFNDLEKTKQERPSITALTIQVGYYNTNNSYNLSKSLYKNNSAFILNTPKEAQKEETTVGQVVQSTILLSHFGEALYKVMDTTNGNKVLLALNEIVKITANRFPGKDREMAHVLYAQYLLFFHRAEALKSTSLVLESFSFLGQLLMDNKTPEYLKNYISFALNEQKLIFFIQEKNVDSTAHYLKKFEDEYKKESIVYNSYTIQRYKALALYNEGFYRHSADTLLSALKLLDSARSVATQEVDEMMYAQAKAEEQNILLKEAELMSTQKERTIRVVFFGGIFLLVVGVSYVWRQRQRQRKELLEFKLNMARNIHDETAPALLYAKSLAKSYRSKENSDEIGREMERQLDNTIEVIRSLSHDLKSNVLHSISSIVMDTNIILKKLKNVYGFSYRIKEEFGKDRFVSHYQYSNLKSIIYECITNSVKHGEFNEIDIVFAWENNHLLITYSDNGKGWDENNIKKGIGLDNISERAEQINGNVVIENNFPNSYKIYITVLLRK